MTLTTILPTLRLSIPDPHTPGLWPAETRMTVTDVIVAGVSLSALAAARGTPCRPAAADGILLMRVTGCVDGVPSRLLVDAEFDAAAVCAGESRLVGRASRARAARFEIGGPECGCLAELPGDVGIGDLLAVPIAHGAAPTQRRVARLS